MIEENASSSVSIGRHARMWPRQVFDFPSTEKKGSIAEELDILDFPGIYILYRDDVPFYIGQATKLRQRLKVHSTPGRRYDLFWNYFSVFVVQDKSRRNELEALLITAFPTANGTTPKIKEREPFPKKLVNLSRKLRRLSK